MEKEINKISIMLRITLNAEDLNNEETIGNITDTRKTTLANREIRQAISGEILKHYHTTNLRNLATKDEVCEDCKIINPMRNGTIKEIDKNLSFSGNRVKNCIIEDIEGFMNPKEGKRSSVIKFAMGIATEENEVEYHTQTRVDVTEGASKKKEKDAKSTQMIYNKPVRSNIYGIVITVDLARVGLDDEKMVYTITQEERKSRQKRCVQAIRDMFLDMEGASCSTRLPHITDIEGIVVHKTDRNEVLVKYSPLKDDYLEVNSKIATNSVVFNNMVEFVEVMDNVVL